MPSNFIAAVRRLDDNDDIDDALDVIYDQFNDWISNERVGCLDRVFEDDDFLRQCSFDILLGLLTASIPVKSKLRNRYLAATIARERCTDTMFLVLWGLI